MSYFNSLNPDLLALIPPDAKTVLEIGCGEGALCEAYRRVNPGVRWLAYEVNGDAARIAEKHCDEVFHEDIEEGYIDSIEIRSADCLVFGDVLEHLRDPLGALKRITSIAKPSAQVLASIPNVQHWTIIRDLLAGHWRYTDSGLMDRTHLRWFTLESIRELFDQAGLKVFEVVGRDVCNEGVDRWLRDFMELGWMNSEWQNFQRQARAYQYVVRAIKPPENQVRRRGDTSNKPTVTWSFPKLHIHAVTAEECCARPRIHEPFAMLRTIPGVKCTIGGDGWMGTGPDIYIHQRWRQIDLEQQARIVAKGIVIAELDDDPMSPLYTHGQPFDPMPLRAVHAVQCSTEAIAEIVRPYNPHVMVFPNQIAEMLPKKHFPPGGEITIVFAAQNRESDWAPIMESLNDVLRDHPLVTVRVIHDKAFYDALETDNKKFISFCDYATYRSVLRSADIALLPLEDTPFNWCKSDLKFLEGAAEGVACLMPDTVYWASHKAAKCHSGAIYLSPEGFEEHLRRLIKDTAWRDRIAVNAYTYVRDHRMLAQHFRARYDWYRDLLTTKQELHSDLLARVPGLAPSCASAPPLLQSVP